MATWIWILIVVVIILIIVWALKSQEKKKGGAPEMPKTGMDNSPSSSDAGQEGGNEGQGSNM